jgi:hypothetical protein
MPDSDEKDTKAQAEEFALTTNAVTYILSAAGCRASYRDYIDCLIGFANGRVEFDATDEQILKLRKVTNPNTGGNVYWARDKRRSLLEWQKANDLFLLNYDKGQFDRKLKRRGPSHYTFHLIDYIKQVIANAQTAKLLWRSDRTLAIKYAATKLVDELRTRPKDDPEKEYTDPPTEVLRKLNSAKTNIANALRLLEKYDFELSKDDEALVTSIEQLLAKIRKRGFADLLDMKIFAGIEKEPKP